MNSQAIVTELKESTKGATPQSIGDEHDLIPIAVAWGMLGNIETMRMVITREGANAVRKTAKDVFRIRDTIPDNIPASKKLRIRNLVDAMTNEGMSNQLRLTEAGLSLSELTAQPLECGILWAAMHNSLEGAKRRIEAMQDLHLVGAARGLHLEHILRPILDGLAEMPPELFSLTSRKLADKLQGQDKPVNRFMCASIEFAPLESMLAMKGDPISLVRIDHLTDAELKSLEVIHNAKFQIDQ